MKFHLGGELKEFYNKDLMILIKEDNNSMIIEEENNEQDHKDKKIKDPVLKIGDFLPLKHCCSICQGILQIVDREDFVNSISEKTKSEGFEFESFKFNVSSPLSTNFRYPEKLKKTFPQNSKRTRGSEE